MNRRYSRALRAQICHHAEAGFTLLELLIVVAVISILAAFAVPGLLRARRMANESSAIASLKAVDTAQELYSKVCGNGGYSDSFLTLGAPLLGGQAPLLANDLTGSAAPTKAGYQFGLVAGASSSAGPTACDGSVTQTVYYSTAVPQTFGTSGGRSFASDVHHTIWQTSTATAPTQPFGAPATTIQ